VVVRVGIRVEAGGKVIEAVSLACSGYETKAPQLMVPVKLAEELGCWPPKHAIEAEFNTVGGPLKV